MEIIRQAGIVALLSLAIDFVPLVMALAYVVRPTERRLALMRPLSLAGLFSALSGTTVGIVSVLRGIAVSDQLSDDVYGRAAAGASEALVTAFVGFACLTAAWLLVAAGMSRSRAEP